MDQGLNEPFRESAMKDKSRSWEKPLKRCFP
jgi:hypothetical protein